MRSTLLRLLFPEPLMSCIRPRSVARSLLFGVIIPLGALACSGDAARMLGPGALPLKGAKPIAQFHDHFTDAFSAEICGIPTDANVVVTDNFFLYADESFKDASSVRSTFTNPVNGKSVVVSSAGQISGRAIVDEEARTITFVTSYKGLPEKIQTANGPVLLRDAGIITFVDTFNLDTGEFISGEIIVKGPHPEAASDFTLFCEVISSALT
jgi:hypothetical protein